MIYSLAADAVVLLHLGFVAFVVFGGFLVVRWRRLAWLHLPAAAWGALVELAGWICPLTPLEAQLRRRAGETATDTGFIEHYLLPILYPAELTRGTQWILGLLVIAINVVAYTLAWRRHRGPVRSSTS